MKKEQNKHWDVIVVGGGPSGMIAAGRAAALGARVLLLEKNSRCGEKLLITGGGRSNITNDKQDPREFLAKFKGKSKFLYSLFSQFSVKETLEFFHAQGMATITEEEDRVFPSTERAETVQRTLLAYMKQGGVTIRSNTPVTGIAVRNGQVEGLTLGNGEQLLGTRYIFATGGMSRPDTGSTGDGFRWLKKLGYRVGLSESALVPVKTKEQWAHTCSGLAMRDVKVTVMQNGTVHLANEGKILFTHVGLSGPLILNMSRSIGEMLKWGPVTLLIDCFPHQDAGALDRMIQTIFQKGQNKLLKNVLGDIVPATLAAQLPTLLHCDPLKEVNKVTRAERLVLVKFLKAIPITPTGLLGKEKAIITSGGLALEEIDMRTMRLLRHPNCYVTGDVLDIDRPSGGYSLQLCWTTGWVAGKDAAKEALGANS